MLGFPRTDDAALVAALGEPHRRAAAYRELMRRGRPALDAIRAGLGSPSPEVRTGCCQLLDHLVDTESMDLLIAMVDDPDKHVRVATFHALACDRCKGDVCAPGADRVLPAGLDHLATDPDAHVRAMAVELVGKFVHSHPAAREGLAAARTGDPSPAVRKKAGWYLPGGAVYRRTAPEHAEQVQSSR